MKSLKKTMSFFKTAIKSEKIPKNLGLTKFLSHFSSADGRISNSKIIENKLEKLQNHIKDNLSFFNLIISTEQDFQAESLRIFKNWSPIQNIFLINQLNDVREKLINLFSEPKIYVTEAENSINKCEVFIEEIKKYSIEVSQTQLGTHQFTESKTKIKDFFLKFSNIIENCKENMLKSLYQQNCTMIDSLLSIISLLDKIDDYEPDIQFNRVAKNHRNQCPLYVPDLMDEDITTNPVQEPIKSGSPESAVWLNDLLATFISE